MGRTKLSALARRFGSDAGGNVAMLVAVAIVPLSVAAMGALDLTRAMSGKVALQDALDAAALAAGRSGATDAASLQQVGGRVLAQNLAGTKDITLTSSSFGFGPDGTIQATAQASFQPSMSGLFGAGQGVVQVSAEVTRAQDILEIAMVLDNTGSMNQTLGSGDSKISYLRTAAKNFVTSLAGAAAHSTTPDAVRISLVPFSNAVNVGTAYRNATWIDQNAASPINDQIFTNNDGATTAHANRFTLFKNLGTSWGGCVEMRKAPYDIEDTAPSTTDPATLYTPFFAPDEDDDKGVNDYISDPSKDNNGESADWWGRQGNIAKYSKTPKVKLTTSKGPNAGCTMQAIQRLTTDFDSLKTAIGNMVADGDTNIPNGLMWGWHTLSPNGPFGDGVAYKTAKHKKIVVLMTDGQNTMTSTNSKWKTVSYNNGSYSSAGYIWQGRFTEPDGTPLTAIDSSDDERTAVMDSRLAQLCTHMKASNVDIEIYTVGVGVTSSSKTLLQSCASGPDHYIDVAAGSDLNAAFQSVANSIAQLHLSK